MWSVMIVDDEYDIREGLKNLPQWENNSFYVTATAKNGIEALEAYKKHKPNLVFIDIKMPVMDGLELAERLKSENPDLNMIILSGFDHFEYAKKAIYLGIDGYLLKPVDTKELEDILCKVRVKLESKKSGEALSSERNFKIRDYVLFRLVTGAISRDEVKAARILNEEFFEADEYSVVLIEIEGFGLANSLIYDKYNLNQRYVLEKITSDILSIKDKGYFFWPNENIFAIIFYRSDIDCIRDNEWPQGTLQIICKNISSYTKRKTRTGFGGCTGDYKGIGFSFLKALISVNQEKTNDSDCSELIYSNSEEAFVENSNALGMIEFCNRQTFANSVSELLNSSINESREVFILQANSIAYGLLDLCIKSRDFFDKDALRKTNIFLYAANMELNAEPKEIIKKLSILASDLYKIIDNKDVKEDSRDVDINGVIKWIDKHFHEDISLKDIAAAFHFHPFYLGQLIKKETNVSFNNYVNLSRINQAAGLLRDTEMTINEIMERVGFKYLDHFYRTFKKIIGINPGEYRKKFNGL